MQNLADRLGRTIGSSGAQIDSNMRESENRFMGGSSGSKVAMSGRRVSEDPNLRQTFINES